MNAAVILAAGSSSRMGFPKQLAEVRDKPLLQAIIDKVNINFDNSSVVLGSENEIISEKIDFKNSNILINENWPEGITSSIRTALFFYQNQKEINNIRKAHYHDGVALTKYLFWIKKNFYKRKIQVFKIN